MFRLVKVIFFCVKVDTAESGDPTTRVGAYKILRGHKASVASVAAQKYGSKVCHFLLPLTCVSLVKLLCIFIVLTCCIM